MDPVTFAVISALTAGVSRGLAEEPAVDAYNALKLWLARKFGNESAVLRRMDELERQSHPDEHMEALSMEVEAVHADQDPELLAIARRLLAIIQDQQTIPSQTATGNYIAQASQGGTASVSINMPKDDANGQ